MHEPVIVPVLKKHASVPLTDIVATSYFFTLISHVDLLCSLSYGAVWEGAFVTHW